MDNSLSSTHLQYVLSNEGRSSIEISTDYHKRFDRSYDDDNERVKSSFLKNLSLDAAFELYEVLCGVAQRYYVSLIKKFHHHLAGVAEVHDYFNLMEQETESPVFS